MGKDKDGNWAKSRTDGHTTDDSLTIDPARLRRSLELVVLKQDEAGNYCVSGETDDHIVTVKC